MIPITVVQKYGGPLTVTTRHFAINCVVGFVDGAVDGGVIGGVIGGVNGGVVGAADRVVDGAVDGVAVGVNTATFVTCTPFTVLLLNGKYK